MSRILFISHDASRTGAPIVLLHFLRWFKKSSDIEFIILLKDTGPLESDFNNLAKTYLWNKPRKGKGFFFRLIQRLENKIFARPVRQEKILTQLKKERITLIYSNTVASHDLIPLLKAQLNAPVISHIHEMSYTISNYYPHACSNAILSQIDYFIAASQGTAKNLMSEFKIPTNRIQQVYEFVDTTAFNEPAQEKEMVKKKLGIRESFIVGGAGITSWRKGIDLFVDIRKKMSSLIPFEDVAFLWVGQVDKEFTLKYEYEKKIVGNSMRIYFTGQQPNPADYFQLFNVFVLPSREDPFPLVCLEAAAMGKPLLCFEGAGGIPEGFNEKGACVIPYGNTEQMASEILSFYKNRERCSTVGEMARETSKGYDTTIIAPQIEQIIKKVSGLEKSNA